MELNWDKLLGELDDQKCILFLGPEIELNGIPLNEAIRQFLKTHSEPDQILHYYNRDGFFLFKNGRAKSDARRQVKRFFLENTYEENILLQILAIPFPMVVSTNADTALSDLAFRYGVRHRFGYFENRNRPAKAVETPSIAEPLFYNLCGCKDQDDSLLLDYDDVFQFLQSVLGSPGLPQKLLEAFSNAITFLFLGFQFEKWHTQLLLRLLQGDRKDEIRSFVIPSQSHNLDDNQATNDPVMLAVQSYKQSQNTDTETFLVSQFDINFLSDPVNFLQELYRRCEAAGKLRKLGSPLSLEATEIIRDIRNNRIIEALERLNQHAEKQSSDDLLKEAAFWMYRFTNLEEEERKGTIDSRDANKEHNTIVDAILEIVQTIS